MQEKINQELKEMEECTFKPMINQKTKNLSHQNRTETTFFDRNLQWREQVEAKITSEKAK